MHNKDNFRNKFPAMSAHFAQTLSDMQEKYIEINFVELHEESGVLSEEDLKTLLRSRANVIVLNNCLYRLMRIEANNYMYISLVTAANEEIVSMKEICVDINTRVYFSKVLVEENFQEIIDRMDTVEEEVNQMEIDVAKAVSDSSEALDTVNTLAGDIETLSQLINNKVSASVEETANVANYVLVLKTDQTGQ